MSISNRLAQTHRRHMIDQVLDLVDETGIPQIDQALQDIGPHKTILHLKQAVGPVEEMDDDVGLPLRCIISHQGRIQLSHKGEIGMQVAMYDDIKMRRGRHIQARKVVLGPQYAANRQILAPEFAQLLCQLLRGPG